jgi:integration host factor subunit beta
MKHLTKSELIDLIAARMIAETSTLSKKDVVLAITTVFDTMSEALRREDRIEIRGFGSFTVKHRQSRDGRNPKTGESVKVPPKRIPFFTVGKELRDRVNQVHASEQTTEAK